MRFFLNLEEHNGSYELDSWQPETTIADLVQATGGPSPCPPTSRCIAITAR